MSVTEEGGRLLRREWPDGTIEFAFACNYCNWFSNPNTNQDEIDKVAMSHFEEDHVGISYGGLKA